MEALHRFYVVEQGARPFSEFLQELQSARNTLATTGQYAITDGVFKNHLLRAQEILTLCMMAIPSFAFNTMKVDSLVSLMAATADSMVAEAAGTFSVPLPPSSSMCCPFPPSSSPSPFRSSTPASPMPYALPEISYADRQNLKSAGGCYHCCKMPSSPGWRPHIARNCPGDAAAAVPPRQSNPQDVTVAVVMPSCVLEGSDTDNSEDDYGDWNTPNR